MLFMLLYKQEVSKIEDMNCNVRIYTDEERQKQLGRNLELNPSQMIALKMSKTIYIINRYYIIKQVAYNFEYDCFEIFVEE